MRKVSRWCSSAISCLPPTCFFVVVHGHVCTKRVFDTIKEYISHKSDQTITNHLYSGKCAITPRIGTSPYIVGAYLASTQTDSNIVFIRPATQRCPVRSVCVQGCACALSIWQ